MAPGTLICRTCGTTNEIVGIVGRRDTCGNCGADLRSCRHCRHHDPSGAGDCRETQAEPVPDKEKANFCDFFQPALGGAKGKGDNLSKAEAERKWEELFAKK